MNQIIILKETLLDKIVIGQRLGETFKMILAEKIIIKPILNYLSNLVNESNFLDDSAKSHYLENGAFKRELITASELEKPLHWAQELMHGIIMSANDKITSEPLIRVGIILPEDKYSSIKIQIPEKCKIQIK